MMVNKQSVKCPVCGKIYKGNGITLHLRKKHPEYEGEKPEPITEEEKEPEYIKPEKVDESTVRIIDENSAMKAEATVKNAASDFKNNVLEKFLTPENVSVISSILGSIAIGYLQKKKGEKDETVPTAKDILGNPVKDF